METPLSPILWWATSLTLVMLTAAMLLTFWRLLKGPGVIDRVVALDLFALLVVGFVCVFDIQTANAVFLDVAIVLALVAFLGTVAFARFVERDDRRRNPD